MKYLLVTCLSLILVCTGISAIAVEKQNRQRLLFENDKLAIRLSPRSPEQIAAFYEARGFPRNMIARLKQECFITVGISNKSANVLWLDLANWQFTSATKPLRRYHRNEWKPVWQALAVPMASQSTFRWTLLPESLDFRPHEREGGNIILPRVDTPITLTARFLTGSDKRGKPADITIEHIHCAQDRQ
jgi:hypothetical protein